jgi:pectinesterase
MQPDFHHGLLTAALLIAGVASHAAPRLSPSAVRIVLVGDSTVTDEIGWGHGFRQLVTDAAEVVNTAANGRSSKSFITEGRWTDALARKGEYYLIQFGHNDEPGKGLDRETDVATAFPQFMAQYVDGARAAGAIPILVTPLVRRNFDASGRIRGTQLPYVEAVRKIAADKHVPLVDLYARSAALCEQLGPSAMPEFSAIKADGALDATHLNPKGSLLFARLVVDELRRAVPALAAVFRDAAPPAMPDAVVAADGSGQYRSVQEAINAAPQNTTADRRWTIFIKAGTYRELIYVQREKRYVSLVGEDPGRTALTYDLHANTIGADAKPIGTFRTPSTFIDADDFSAENLTFENAAGPVSQALAVRVDGDRVVFRNCRFLGWQDTLLLNRGRQYFEDSLITGHVDFIFGGATAFFEGCRLHAWRSGYITAASTPAAARYGFVFDHANITGASGARTYLGRPWREFAQVTFIRSEMSDVVQPSGWHNWDHPEREETARYFEFGGTGTGAAASGRVRWAKALSQADAGATSAGAVLGGSDHWDPRSVPAHPSAVKVSSLPIPPAPGSPAVSRQGMRDRP